MLGKKSKNEEALGVLKDLLIKADEGGLTERARASLKLPWSKHLNERVAIFIEAGRWANFDLHGKKRSSESVKRTWCLRVAGKSLQGKSN